MYGLVVPDTETRPEGCLKASRTGVDDREEEGLAEEVLASPVEDLGIVGWKSLETYECC